MSGISVRGRNPIALPKSYFSVVLLITLLWYCLLCWVVVTFQSVDEMLWCDYSNESYWAVLSCGSGYYALQGDSNLLSLRVKSYGVTIEMKATEQYFPVVLFIMLYKVVLTFESVDEILWCGHSNESYWTVLSQSTIYCKVFCRMKFNFFFSSVYNSLLTFQAVAVSSSCHWTILKFAVLSNRTCDLQWSGLSE